MNRVVVFYFIHRKHVVSSLCDNFTETVKSVTDAVNPLNLVGEGFAETVKTVTDAVNPLHLVEEGMVKDSIKRASIAVNLFSPAVESGENQTKVGSAFADVFGRIDTEKRNPSLESALAKQASLKNELKQLGISIKNLQLHAN